MAPARSDLYHPELILLSQDLTRWRNVPEPHYVIKAYNRICGDKFEIYFNIDGTIVNTSFFGYGCVVSKASTVLLTELISHRSIEDARRLITFFLDRMNNTRSGPLPDARMEWLLAAKAYPGRVQCAVLPWEALVKNPVFRDK
jgi:nitrogen fixation NifU-like protein